jgi:hypothetical protein
MMLIASARVVSLSRKAPRTAEVTVRAPGLRTPRIVMHRCSASMTTTTPRGSSVSTSASAIWLVITTEQTELGEGIRWDARRDELLAVDILAGHVYRGRVRDDGALERVRVYELPWTVGMIAPIEGDEGWLLGAGRGFVYLAPDGTHRTIAEVSPAGTRMNDGACDPQGRFWGAGRWPTTTTREVARSTGWTGPAVPNRCSVISRSPTESAGAPTA